jgi:hypothetical protein
MEVQWHDNSCNAWCTYALRVLVCIRCVCWPLLSAGPLRCTPDATYKAVCWAKWCAQSSRQYSITVMQQILGALPPTHAGHHLTTSTALRQPAGFMPPHHMPHIAVTQGPWEPLRIALTTQASSN